MVKYETDIKTFIRIYIFMYSNLVFTLLRSTKGIAVDFVPASSQNCALTWDSEEIDNAIA